MEDPKKTPQLKKLREFTRFMPEGQDLQDALNTIINGSDHASALVAVAWIDQVLKMLISFKFRDDLSASEKNTLFEDSGPLSTSWGKIHTSYALGLIGPKTKADTLKILQIRNIFAHAAYSVSFKTPEVIQACEALSIDEGYVAAFAQDGASVDNDARKKFIWCCCSVILSTARLLIDNIFGKIDASSNPELAATAAEALAKADKAFGNTPKIL